MGRQNAGQQECVCPASRRTILSDILQRAFELKSIRPRDLSEHDLLGLPSFAAMACHPCPSMTSCVSITSSSLLHLPCNTPYGMQQANMHLRERFCACAVAEAA